MRIFWKVYFWIFAFIVVSGYTAMLSENTTIYHYFDMLFSILGLVGLWCYAYGKGLLHPGVWRLFFCLFFFWNVINIIYGPFYACNELVGQKEQLHAKLIPIAISLPAYFALFLYGFRSEEIWHKS
jgi:hypothetical protein